MLWDLCFPEVRGLPGKLGPQAQSEVCRQHCRLHARRGPQRAQVQQRKGLDGSGLMPGLMASSV